MGFLDSLMDMATASTSNSFGVGGIIGKKLGDAEKKMKERSAREKPGVMCIETCVITGDYCVSCCKRQKEITEMLEVLEALDDQIKRANEGLESATPAFTKCTLCAAPYEKGLKACPYCDTPYPAGAGIGDLPATKLERDKLLLTKTTEMYKKYSDWNTETVTKNTEASMSSMPGWIGKVGTAFMSKSMQIAAMNANMIQAGAKDNNVGYVEYVQGVMAGTYKSHGQVLMEKQMEEQQRLQAQQAQRQAQQQAAMAQRQTGSSGLDYIQRHNEMSGGVGYVGGPQSVGYCCGNCVHYMSHSNECAYSSFFHPSGASDYCVNHRSS